MMSSRLIALALAFTCCAAAAQSYPTRPIRMIVPQAPGSASDTVARIIAAELTQRLKQQVVVDNRPGGALLLGLDLASKAPPDGYTLGYCMIGAMAISPNMQAKPPLNVLAPEALRAYVDHGFADEPDGSVRLKCLGENEARTYEGSQTHDAFERLGEVSCPVLVLNASGWATGGRFDTVMVTVAGALVASPSVTW